ncbi:SPFH domain-containing protein [Streptacidiphilus carbonis]|uniref:SPFH domain-containing protein n=1 Tax=Streptacidiphilus carbonis TaxID=105422 RepID=UPI000693B583|nr:SPFH domain-containing protein [Streptacidiphilus carbonis]
MDQHWDQHRDQHTSPAEAPSADPAVDSSADPSTGGVAALGSSAVRRPPRVDSELRERPARGVLPGWVALTALLAAGTVAVLVQAGRQALPGRIPGAGRLNEVLTGTPLSRPEAGGLLLGCALLAGVAVFGLMANPVGGARVLTRWGGYRGTVRRTGLIWVNPLLKRRTVDVRVRHWRSEPIAATDREGSPLRAELLLVWSVRDTARAGLAVPDHQAYLSAAAEAALCRVAATLPCDSFASPGPSLRDGQWLGGELTRLLAVEAAPVGITVFSAQALTLDYTEEFATAMRRRRLAELDAGTREVIVGDALETAALTVSQLEHSQGLALPQEARTALLRDLVASFLAPPPPAAPSTDLAASTVVTPRTAASVNGATPTGG